MRGVVMAGDHSRGVPPDPIPNSTVKPSRAYDTLS